MKDLAATYSRGSYTTTTIGKAVFDGRVRDGNGSGHSFMTTKITGATAESLVLAKGVSGHKVILKYKKSVGDDSLKTTHRTDFKFLSY
jgi:hypothetical protein